MLPKVDESVRNVAPVKLPHCGRCLDILGFRADKQVDHFGGLSERAFGDVDAR